MRTGTLWLSFLFWKREMNKEVGGADSRELKLSCNSFVDWGSSAGTNI